MNDNALLQFDAHGALALPKADQEGTIQHDEARLFQ